MSALFAKIKKIKMRYGILMLFCGAFWVFAVALCLGAELFAPYSYEAQNMHLGASAPSFSHIFGTDMMGRDLFSRLLYGGRISFMIAFFASFAAIFIGTIYGTVSGMAGGKTDSAMMRFVDMVYSLPFTIFVILLMLLFGRSLLLMFIAIGAVEWLTMARIARAMTLDLKSRQFVEAARCMGQSKSGIIFKHIIPNLSDAIFVCLALTMPGAMLLESFLSFLGLGVQAPLPSLGGLVKDGAEYMEDAPWLLIFPAAFFAASLYSINLVGEKLSPHKK